MRCIFQLNLPFDSPFVLLIKNFQRTLFRTRQSAVFFMEFSNEKVFSFDHGFGGNGCGTGAVVSDWARRDRDGSKRNGARCACCGHGLQATATGNTASAAGDRSTAIGQIARSPSFGSVAVGEATLAGGIDSLAIGRRANANAPSSIAIGAFSVAVDPNTVSVGSGGVDSIGVGVPPSSGVATRRIVNVSAGIASNDAATVGQVKKASDVANAAQIDATTALTGGANDSVARTRADAALQIANGVGVRVDELDKRAMAGVASGLAIAGAPPAVAPDIGETVGGVGVGGYGGQAAVAVSLLRGFATQAGTPFYGRVSLGLAGGKPALSVGASFKF